MNPKSELLKDSEEALEPPIIESEGIYQITSSHIEMIDGVETLVIDAMELEDVAMVPAGIV